MTPIKILCAGGHCKVIIDSLLSNDMQIHGIYDDFKDQGVFYRGISILGKISDVLESDTLIIACGDNRLRKSLYEKFPKAIYPNCIDKDAIISPTMSIGVGNYIGPGAVISADTCIGSYNILNNSSIIGHDVVIKDFCHIAPGSVLGGNVTVLNDCLIGSGSRILPKLIMDKGTTIGSGCVMVKSSQKGITYVGVPGKNL